MGERQLVTHKLAGCPFYGIGLSGSARECPVQRGGHAGTLNAVTPLSPTNSVALLLGVSSAHGSRDPAFLRGTAKMFTAVVVKEGIP